MGHPTVDRDQGPGTRKARWLSGEVSHPFARKKAKGWGTELLCPAARSEMELVAFSCQNRDLGHSVFEVSARALLDFCPKKNHCQLDGGFFFGLKRS
jgi:hypothetical protein